MNDPSGDAVRELRQAFGDSLYGAAVRLVQSGGVLEVRLLQAGNIITGIVGADAAEVPRPAKFRVYIRKQTGRTEGQIEGECSCGALGVCVHVAAVSIVAAGTAGKPAEEARPARQHPVSVSLQSAPAQQLCYVLETLPVGDAGVSSRVPAPSPAFCFASPFSEFRVSVWVAQRGADVGSSMAASACAFVPRLALGRSSAIGTSEFPRYVDGRDREILIALTAQASEGPWVLRGEAGAAVLLRVVATGRAFQRSLRGRVLHGGEPRRLVLGWATRDGGEQVLSWEDSDSLSITLDAEPPVYLDSESGSVGQVDLPCSLALLREYARQVAVTPEQVAAVNARIDEAAGGSAFPRLRSVAAIGQALVCVAPQLLLSADAQALPYFVYNGTPVDRRRLREEQDTVRTLVGESLYEIPRDRATERLFEAQLAGVLGSVPDGRAAWLAFMMDGVPALRALGWDIVLDKDFPYQLVTSDQWYGDLEADLRQSAWFNLRLGVLVDGRPVNLLPALTRYLQSALDGDAERQSDLDTAGCRIGERWLVRLEDGRYLPMAMERIQRIANTLVELFDRDTLNAGQMLSIPRSQSGRLAQLAIELQDARVRPGDPGVGSGEPRLSANGLRLSCDDPSLAALVEELRTFSGIQALPAPAGFQGTLRPYQEEGLGWLQFLRRFGLGGMLADDMGLGKTVQTIAHIALELASGRLNKPVLIVAPVSALGNWQHELTRFAPGLTVHTWHGAQRRRSAVRLDNAQVIITAYPLLLIDGETLLARDFGLVILDEAQMIKNPDAKVSQAARALRAECRLCLSGTPVENHLGELWSLFEFLQPGLLGDERYFQRHYRAPIEKNGDRVRAEALSARLAPFLLRRTKDSVAKELPPKVEIVESITFDEKQRDYYDGIRLAMHQHIQEVVRQQGLARSQITILDALLKLRQVCCDPRLVEVGRVPEGVPSAKLDWLSRVLPELLAEGRRILLFSQFTSMLRLIEPMVTQLAIPYCLLSGATQDRAAVVDRFQSGQAALFLISLKAGGTALNLTAADTVIHYDPWWNPAVEAQATDRAHRIGQTKSVFVYKLIAQDTVEERMLQLQADKRALAGRLYTRKSGSPTALGAQDLEILFAP